MAAVERQYGGRYLAEPPEASVLNAKSLLKTYEFF